MSPTTASAHLANTSTRRARRRRIATAAALVAAGALVSAGPAAADSIVYIDGGNVWSTSPDGGHKVQLTDGGDWHSPTQSDNGKVAAVEGASNLITVMANDGRVLHTIATQPARSGDGATFAPRPVELSFSPDGGRIAYSYVANSCANGSTCGTIQRSTFYTYENVNDATAQSVFGEQFSVSDPEWMTNDRVVVTGGYGTGLSYDDLAGGGDSSFTHWIPWPAKDANDAEVSRDGTRLAMVWDYGANTKLSFSSVSGNALSGATVPDPTPACETNRDETFADPSWSPDGSAIVVHDSDGLDVLRFSGFGPHHCELTSAASIGAGTEPDWGPADPPAARYAAPATGSGSGSAASSGSSAATPSHGTAGTTTKPGTGTTTANGTTGTSGAGNTGSTHPADGTPAVTSASVKLADLRRGKATVRVSVPAGGRVTVTLSSGKTTIATAHATARSAGAVTLHLSKAGRRALAALTGRSSALVRITVSGKGTERLEGSGPIRVR